MTARLRLVVADNDDDALELVVTDLALEGHDVVAAVASGDEAVAACAALHPDVLVSDFRMPPGPDGVAVAEAVRDVDPSIRVVLYSNYVRPALIEAARRAGALVVPKGDLRDLRKVVSGQRDGDVRSDQRE